MKLRFTPWLAANVDYLSEALGLELELEGIEVPVGPFSADILLRDANTQHRVVVENLFHASDHDHLGKVITYSAGLEAHYAVLVGPSIRIEHRSALKWLNEISEPGRGFFGVEISAVRIGGRPPAALRLEVVVAPDDWRQQVREASSSLSDQQQLYLRWWSEFIPALKEQYPGWTSASKPSTGNWMTLPTGKSGIRYGIDFSWPDNQIGRRMRVSLYMDDGARYWSSLVKRRAQIDAAFGPGLLWEELPERRASRIAVDLMGAWITEENRWGEFRAWALAQLGRFREVFQPIVAELE